MLRLSVDPKGPSITLRSEGATRYNMYEKIRPLWAEINLDNLAYNAKNIKERVGERSVIAIIKADAYGHGAPEVAETLIEAGADAFGVSIITEALQLREKGIGIPIIVLSYTPETYMEDAVREDITLNCLSYDYAVKLDGVAKKYDKKVKVLISIDTGIGRLGYSPDEKGMSEIEKIARLEHIEMDGIYTHFALSDSQDKSFTYVQLERYKKVIERLRKDKVIFNHYHAANSAAIVDMKETYFDSVRPGIILYGYYPSNEVVRGNISIKPVMSIKGIIIRLKSVPKGTGISYGHRFVTEREETSIATIPIGYADGYFRALSGKGKVIVNGVLCPQVGTVCMDHIMVDVTGVPDVKEGDTVTIMGSENGVSFTAEDIAEILQTIPYEVLCAVSKRVPRVYLKGGKEVMRKSYV